MEAFDLHSSCFVRHRSAFALLLLLTAAACSTATNPAAPAAPPWSHEALPSAQVPQVYVTEWRSAENRTICALIAPQDLGAGSAGTPRRAEFSGGWAVAYDLPELRSAFGIAGTGAHAADPSYASWPNVKAWNDGSTVGYGPEGGSGPNQLAYLRVAGQGCLYNVWSRVSKEHLEHLIDNLRFVETNDLERR